MERGHSEAAPGAVLDRPLESSTRAFADRLSRPSRPDAIGLTLVVVGSLIAASLAMELWRAHLHLPLDYTWDGIFTAMVIKPIVNGGWILTNHSLGAPFGTQFYDYPLGTDNLNWLMMKIIGLGTGDPFRVMNLFFLLTFPVNGGACYVVLRWLRASVLSSVVCSILFAVMPYHLLQGEDHLLLSSYAAVPIGAYLTMSVLRGTAWSSSGRSPLRRWCTWRNGGWVLLCVVVGSLGVYYAAFTMVLVAAAGLASAVNARSWRRLVPAVFVIGAIGLMGVINDSPSIIYEHIHGKDELVAHRVPQESELYSLNLAGLVFPPPGDRISAFNSLRYRYDTTTPVPGEGADSLGIVGALGFLWLGAIALAAIIDPTRAGPWLSRQRPLAFGGLMAFLIGTFGGVSALIGYLVTAQIRGWDRISIFVSFFALASVALVLDTLRERFTQRRAWYALAAGVVLVAGVYDQSSREAVPPYKAIATSFGSDAQFAQTIEKTMPAGASILQLPYVPFPENPPVNRMVDYDELRGYLHSSGLNWSYGALKGLPTDWHANTQAWPLRTLIDGAVASGFSGLYIDRFGYTDNGAAIEAEARSLLGAAPISSRDGRLLFFDLRPYAAALRAATTPARLAALREATLRAPAVTLGAGFYSPDTEGSVWATPDAVQYIANTTGQPRRMIFSAAVQTAARGRWRLTIGAPDGSVKHVAIDSKARAVRFAFTDPPGTHAISFASSAPVTPAPGDPRSLSVYYGQQILGDASLAPFLFSPGATAVR